MISNQLHEIKESLKESVELIAVSKTFPVKAIQEAYNVGQRAFGENKVQEMMEKYPLLPKDVQWHLIGHLQTNKVKYIAPFVKLIHSVDSLKLAKEINKQAEKNERVIECLLQFHIATEETKFGLDLQEAHELLNSETFKEFKNIRFVGVMGMASFSEDLDLVRNEFKRLKSIFDQLKKEHFSNDKSFKEISMGMSGDYKIAMEEGSTMVRVGSLIFGSR